MKEYCCKCHLAYGSAEPRVPIDEMRTMHKDCYDKHLRELSARAVAVRGEGTNRVQAHKRYG